MPGPEQSKSTAGAGKRKADDIDDIFASGPKVKAHTTDDGVSLGSPGRWEASTQELLQTSSVSKRQKKKSKNNKNKSAGGETQQKDQATVDSAAPVIVFSEETPGNKNTTQSSQPRPNDEDSSFADTRGLNNKKKYTDEGYAVYTFEDLKVGLDGGDTELCPFDCDCCF